MLHMWHQAVVVRSDPLLICLPEAVFFLYSRMRAFSWSCEADVPSFFQMKEGTKEGGGKGEEEEEVEDRREERGKEDREEVFCGKFQCYHFHLRQRGELNIWKNCTKI